MTKHENANATALFLMATIAVTLVALPLANAHDPAWILPTWTYVYAANNPIGVGQDTLIVYWSNAAPPTAIGPYGDHWTFWIDIKAPDGSKTTLGPYESDPIGGSWLKYTPTNVGTYTIVVRMDEHVITGTPAAPPGALGPVTLDSVNDTYLASASDPLYLTVQEEQIQAWPETPLPTQYWTRPINSENREWAVLAGNWLAAEAQNVGPTTNFGYGTGPESAHIMWATPMYTGGIMDARFNDTGYATFHYEGLDLIPPIILDGKIFYNVQSYPREGWYCLDLYTGETLYFHNTTGPAVGANGGSGGAIIGERLAFGQIINYDSPNQHGGFPYLWSTPPFNPWGPPVLGGKKWMMFDAYSGNYICSIADVPSWVSYGAGFFFGADTNVYGKEGSLLSYQIANLGSLAAPSYYLQCWNSSKCIMYEFPVQGNDYWLWRPGLNRTYDGNQGYSLNVSIPTLPGGIITIREGDKIIGGNSGTNDGTTVVQGHLWALNLNPNSAQYDMGELMWDKTFTPPESEVPAVPGTFGYNGMSGPKVDPEDDVFFFNEGVTRRWWGYSLDTMKQIWGPSEPEGQLNFYGTGFDIYQGKLITYGWSGQLIAYDAKTGDVLWTYNATNVGFESPFGNYPIGIGCIADGKIYAGNCEHSPSQPLWRGSYLRCVNVSNGAELWKIQDYGIRLVGGASGNNIAISDGYLVTLNAYDNQIYCYGKGPSDITVSAPQTIITQGQSLMVTGTVTDQSPGAIGTPAIADADQQVWMEYLYMQQAKPTDAKGVEVVLETLDPNGNFYEIGRTTSDTSGNYGYKFTPEVPGTYQIIATFEGSAAYGPSSDTTYLSVDEAPQATPTAPPPEQSMADIYFMPMSVGIIIAIVAVGLVLVLLLRKR